MQATIVIEFDTDTETTTFSCKGLRVISAAELATQSIHALTAVMGEFLKVANGEGIHVIH